MFGYKNVIKFIEYKINDVSGNNENEVAIAQHWYSKSNDTLYKKDYVELYINHIRKLLLPEDTSRPFVSSSPSNGLVTEEENWIAKNPQSTKYGDVHYYNYKDPLWNWTIFPSAKFASEYGFESYPSLETLSQVIKDSDLTYPISEAIADHQHYPHGVSEMDKQICKPFKIKI